jgi:hypothetical protein
VRLFCFFKLTGDTAHLHVHLLEAPTPKGSDRTNGAFAHGWSS